MPQPITLLVVTDACQIVKWQIFARCLDSPCGPLLVANSAFEMADEFTCNTFLFRITIPLASLDPSIQDFEMVLCYTFSSLSGY